MNTEASINYFDIMNIAKKNYSRLMTPLCRTYDLTRNELDVLLFLYNNPQYDRAADIVAHRGIAKSHVSLSVANLEERGLLIRRFEPADRRTAHLALTRLGTEITEKAREVQNKFFTAIHEGISDEEFALWGSITRKVSANIQNLDKILTSE